MTDELAAQIEHHLIHQPGDDGWFLQADLVARFQLTDDRDLRATGPIPGPLSRCTIFSGRGVKHLTRSTPEERQKCLSRVEKEHFASANRKRWLLEGISRYVDTNSLPPVEALTGQYLLLNP